MGSIYVDIRATCAKKACLLMLWCEEVSKYIYFTDEGSDKKKSTSTWILHTKHSSYIWWTQFSLPQIYSIRK